MEKLKLILVCLGVAAVLLVQICLGSGRESTAQTRAYLTEASILRLKQK